MIDHFIQIRAIHELRGGFGVEGIGTRSQMDLEMYSEKSIAFKCECGDKFYKVGKAEQHLLENEQ